MIKKELVKMNAYLPEKLADLAKHNPEDAISLLQDWGYGRKTLKVLWSEVNTKLDCSESNVI